MPEANAVKTLFAGIAKRYDFANRILSLGVDVYWRRLLIAQVRACTARTVADLACGSGDVTFALRRGLPADTQIIGLDFCQPMLDEAEQKKTRQLQLYGDLRFAQGDCLALPLADASQDALTIAFGLRNLEDRARGLAEMRRVLKPNGHLFVLEFTQPDRWFRPLYYLYLKTLLPIIAGLATGDKDAYQYLASSIEGFPTRESIQQELYAAGFAQVCYTSATFGIVAIHHAQNRP